MQNSYANTVLPSQSDRGSEETTSSAPDNENASGERIILPHAPETAGEDEVYSEILSQVRQFLHLLRRSHSQIILR